MTKHPEKFIRVKSTSRLARLTDVCLFYETEAVFNETK